MSDTKGREGWSARAGFICAAIGSAVGLGNVWRFPNLSYTYGGGAFFIPFILALLFVGIPILALEFGLGQVFRSGDVVAFGAMHPRLHGVGLGSVWCGFMVVCYYVLIIAWAITMVFNCFQTTDDHFDWSKDGSVVSWFLSSVVGLGDVAKDGNLNRSLNIVPTTWFGITFVWLAIYLCTFKGAKMTGRITYVTMTVPILLLILLAIIFGTMDGAGDGIELYIGDWDVSKLSGSEMCGGKKCQEAWPDAVSQVFFSLSVTFGVMTAYASYNPVNQNVMADATITGLGDLICSFIAGFTIFAALGAASKVSGATGDDIAAGSGGLGLVFWTLPAAFEAMGQKPHEVGMGGRSFLAFLFYFTVVLLGVDSAFSLCEGFSTTLKDSRTFKGWRQEALIGIICLVGYSISILVYATDVGLYMLDTVDYYINVLMLFVGYMECLSAGWFAYSTEHIALIGFPAWCTCICLFIFTSIMAPYVGLGIGGAATHAVGGTVAGLVIGFIGMIATIVLPCLMVTKKPSAQTVKDVLLFNVEKLRAKMNAACGKEAGNMFGIPLLWSLLIKIFIPPLLMLLLVVKLRSPVFGAYEGYPNYYQYWGIAVIVVPLLMLVVGIFKPGAFDWVMPEHLGSLDSLAAGQADGEKNAPAADVVGKAEEAPVPSVQVDA